MKFNRIVRGMIVGMVGAALLVVSGCATDTGLIDAPDGKTDLQVEGDTVAPESISGAVASVTDPLEGTPPLVYPITNLLYNPGFDTQDPQIPASGFVDHGNAQVPWFAGWGTAAENWPATSNDLNWGAIATWLRTDVVHTAGAGKHSILVAAATNSGGIAQQYWSPTDAPPNSNYLRFSVWVYTVSGQVTIGLGNGAEMVTSSSTKTGKWERLETCGTNGNNYKVLIYTTNGPSVYYVDDADLSATISPVTHQYCNWPPGEEQ